jgi:hypothetical protein
MSSYEARQKLQDLKSSDPKFWAELTQKVQVTPDINVEVEGSLNEDNEAVAERIWGWKCISQMLGGENSPFPLLSAFLGLLDWKKVTIL